MKEFKSILELQTSRDLNQNEMTAIIQRLANIEGVTGIDVEANSVKIEYIQYLQSSASIKDVLAGVNFPFQSQSGRSRKLKSFIRSLGDENKKTIGSSHLDCCSYEKSSL